MDLISELADLEQSTELHLARLLILINAFTNDGKEKLSGLTKLAKLDFLLRYPVMLERALQKRHLSGKSAKVEEYERLSVETQMVRYRFGPWDHRYRMFLNLLSAKRLITVNIDGRTIEVSITETGKDYVKKLIKSGTFATYVDRSAVIKERFNLKATELMHFIYNAVPEILNLPSNRPIPAELKDENKY